MKLEIMAFAIYFQFQFQFQLQCRGSQWSANLIGLFELELAPSEILLTAGNDQL